MSDEVFNSEEQPLNDPALLLVRGQKGENKQYIKQLANAVYKVVSKYGYANLRCVGASSVNNAMKAVIIASGEAKQMGVDLVLSPSFHVANFEESEFSSMNIKVFNR